MTNEEPAAAGLPPEVEAELRRRAARAASAAAAVPAGEGLSASAGVPSVPPDAPSASRRPGVQERLRQLGPVGAALAFLLKYVGVTLKFLAPLLKFGLPLLKTGGTMLLSIGFYAMQFGWWFAVGFVVCILVHELGHVFVAWRLGMPVSAPIFIPGMGALILLKGNDRSAWESALIGIGGPMAGTLAGLVCLALFRMTGSGLMLGVAYTTFFLNLFNMAPIYPMDGGRIVGAISPRLWLLGMVGMVIAFITGFVTNPLLLILLFLSLPRLWHGLKTGDITPAGSKPPRSEQRLTMGIAYLSLCGLLVWLMSLSGHVGI